MSWIEEMAVNIVLGILQQVIKNPSKKAAVQSALVYLAESIFESYGMPIPTLPSSPANPPAA